MRKLLLIALFPLFLGSGMIGGTYLLGTSGAQDRYPQYQAAPSNYQAPPGNYAVDWYQRKPAPSHPAQKWEYKTIRRPESGNNDAELNALGEQGWELCNSHTASNSNQVMLVFKRPKQVTVAGNATSEKEYYGAWAGFGEAAKGKNKSASSDYTVFRLQRSSAADVAQVLKETYSKATVVFDPTTNSLHVQCEPATIAEIKKLIQKLDSAEKAGEQKPKPGGR